MYNLLLFVGMFVGGEYTPSNLETTQVCACGPDCKCPNCHCNDNLALSKVRDKLKEKREKRQKERKDRRNKV